jgi:hypothetical protein
VKVVRVDVNGVDDPNHKVMGEVQRIEQCGNRVIITSGGVIHDMRADGTEEGAVHDVAGANKITPITVIATFEDGVHVLRPVGMPLEIRRRVEGQQLVWDYAGFTRPSRPGQDAMSGRTTVVEQDPPTQAGRLPRITVGGYGDQRHLDRAAKHCFLSDQHSCSRPDICHGISGNAFAKVGLIRSDKVSLAVEPDPDSVDEDGKNLLHRAARHTADPEFIVRCGVAVSDIDHVDLLGESAVHAVLDESWDATDSDDAAELLAFVALGADLSLVADRLPVWLDLKGSLVRVHTNPQFESKLDELQRLATQLRLFSRDR